MSKLALGLGAAMSGVFALAITVTPVPERWRNSLVIGSWSLLGILCIAWIIIYFLEKRRASEIPRREREARIDKCVRRASQLLKNDNKQGREIWSFNAICRSKADRLDDNEAVARVCDRLVKHGYKHPFDGLENHVPKNEWLEFVNAAIHRNLQLEKSGDYLLLAKQWPQEHGRPEPTIDLPVRLTVLAHHLRVQGIGTFMRAL